MIYKLMSPYTAKEFNNLEISEVNESGNTRMAPSGSMILTDFFIFELRN